MFRGVPLQLRLPLPTPDRPSQPTDLSCRAKARIDGGYVSRNHIPAVQALAISGERLLDDRDLESQELSELERNFKSFIQSHLSDEEPEDYDFVWQWEKFLFDKSRRVQGSG